MKWYAAHIIEYFKFRDGVQDYYPFYENVVLIEADSSEEAWDKAEQFGNEHQSDDKSLTWNKRPAQLVFAGVRKIIAPTADDENISLRHGMELTYSQMSIKKKKSFYKYLDNKPAKVKIEE